MKKFLALLMMIVILLSVCSCAMSKEDMLSKAINLDWKQVRQEYQDNQVRAKKDYNDKIVVWEAVVFDICDEYVVMSNETYNGNPAFEIHVFLDQDSIATLEKNSEITVVGKLSLDGHHMTTYPCIIDAYLVK